MQSTGQTSRHDSQPVQLSALMTAISFGSFLRGPALAIFKSPLRTTICHGSKITGEPSISARDFFHKPLQLYAADPQTPIGLAYSYRSASIGSSKLARR